MGCRQSKKEEDLKKEEGGAADETAVAAGEEGAGGEGTEPKLIVVFGSTGMQGGAVVRALKPDSKYKVRAVTRDPESDKSKALAELGVEVVKADLDDLESVKKALEGAYGVFAVTNFFGCKDGEHETQQGKNIVDAAKAAGVQHFVYSGLENVKEAIGKSCHHFDSKAQVESYLKEQDLAHTVVRLSFYFENLIMSMKPTKDEDGNYVLGIPMGDVQMAMVSAADCGECVHQVFNHAEEYKDKVVGLGAENLKVEEYAAILNKQFDGKNFVASTKTTDDMAAMDFPLAAEMAVMFEFYQTAPPDRDIDLTKKLNPELTSFEQWVEANKDKLEAVLE